MMTPAPTLKKTVCTLCFFILLVNVSVFAQLAGDYRSFVSGTWNTPASWEIYNGTAWITATVSPTSTDGSIHILSGHTIQLTTVLTIDQLTIDAGATLNWTAAALTLNNGSTGADLVVNGTLIEAGTGGITFGAGATWEMGANGTLVKTTSSASNPWQSSYETGIANIPATSYWILRKTAGTNPPLSTTTPATGSVYPNLTIENNSGAAYPLSFTGTTIFPTIKGNLDIGGSGSGAVITLTNGHTSASPTLVMGNFTLRTGHVFQNNGTGVEVRGNMTVNGNLTYDTDDQRRIVFSGTNPQTLSGTGTMGIYNMTMNKSANTLTLARAITIDNSLTLTSGLIVSTATNLPTLNTNATVTGASNTSFVSGPIRYTGPSAITFPVGKGSDYQPIGISASAAANVFWTETFDGTACPAASGCDPSLVGWTETLPSANGASANRFYVSCQENGNAAGICGTACSGDQSLHLGCLPVAIICSTGDCGAAYNASGAANVSDRRAESPTINCSGYSSIQLSFNYLENGQGLLDNATLWYFDGTTWSQLVDLPKTPAGSCGGQGLWTNYTTTLPTSANGNPNVKIGFRWVNNGDGAGSDPSFAVDDITLTQPSPTSDFTAEYFYNDPQAPYGNLLASPLTTLSSCEYWILNRNAGTESKYVSLTWDANSCPVPGLSTLRVARHDGTSTWQNEGNTATTGSVTAGTITSGLVANFSPFTLADITVLPIQLLDFTAHYDGTHVNCNWFTASELNNDYFTVERSADGQHFTEIGIVNGAGTTNAYNAYLLPDEKPINGLSYYRLKQTDFNGAYSYSQTRTIHINSTEGFHIDLVSQYDGAMQVNYTLTETGNTKLMVHDMTGRLVHSLNITGSTTAYIDRSGWSKGMYTVLITDGKHSDHKKFIVE